MKKLFTSLALFALSLISVAQSTTLTEVGIKVWKANHYYKQRSARPFYTTCTYRFDEITQLANFDIEKFRTTLYADMGWTQASSPEGVLRLMSQSPFGSEGDLGFDEVSQSGKSADYETWYKTHAEDPNDAFPWCAPYTHSSLTYQSYDPDAHVLAMLRQTTTYLGGGTGSSYFYSQDFYYYDFDLGRRLQLSDLLKGEWKQRLTQSVRQWLNDNADDICLFGDASDIELSDTWELRGNVIYFIFPKYSIACGAAGNVEVPVYDDISSLLTPKGKLLLGTE